MSAAAARPTNGHVNRNRNQLMQITFLCATGSVTGSKYLLEVPGKRVLVDCGLFQGYKQLRLRNWDKLPVDPASIDAVILTHAHLDHSGYLPLLIKEGFKGRVFCTPGTRDLCDILLPDSGYLQEQDADYANRHGFSKHRPALPLYTEKDAIRALDRLAALDYEIEHDLGGKLSLVLRNAGHIIGAATATFSHGETAVTFSGDLGRPNDPIMHPPAAIAETDYLVLESTYGDRVHDRADPMALLADIATRTAARGGTIVVPAFAVGRAQLLAYMLWRLKSTKRIPDMPIFLDSPMAIDAGEILITHRRDHRLSEEDCRALRGSVREVRTVEESKALDHSRIPSIIISASGMATGGRVLHHLKAFASDARNTILFTGFQAGGTRGAAMIAGAEQIKIHGAYIPVRAEVQDLNMLSAHADSDELIAWLRNFRRPPKQTFLTHGEPAASDALRRRIEEELHWSVSVPSYRDTESLR